SGVAHDFNNLLASILWRAQLTLQQVSQPQLRQWLQVIERAALDGAQTVRRLQEFTRIRRDQPFVAVDLNEVVREALEITQARWREEAVSRGVMLEVRNDLAALPKVAGDPVELREALTNLILNAVDAMPGGGVLTFVPTRELAEPPTEPPAPPPSGEVSLRCLVVDDEPTVGAMLGDVLETGGHRAVVVTDGSEGIARFGAEPFDVVFTDLAMPRV